MIFNIDINVKIDQLVMVVKLVPKVMGSNPLYNNIFTNNWN